MFAGEGQHAGSVGLDLRQQPRNVERVLGQFVVVADVALGQIGQADAEFGQLRKFLRGQQPWREPGLEQRAPEHVAGVSIVSPFLGRPLACGGPAKHQSQAGAQNVWKDRAVERG